MWLLLAGFLAISLLLSANNVAAQEPTPTTPWYWATEEVTGTPESLLSAYPTETPLPVDGGCPEGLPDGWGTVTPGAGWYMNCRHCLIELTTQPPTATPKPAEATAVCAAFPNSQKCITSTPVVTITATPMLTVTPTPSATPLPPTFTRQLVPWIDVRTYEQVAGSTVLTLTVWRNGSDLHAPIEGFWFSDYKDQIVVEGAIVTYTWVSGSKTLYGRTWIDPCIPVPGGGCYTNLSPNNSTIVYNNWSSGPTVSRACIYPAGYNNSQRDDFCGSVSGVQTTYVAMSSTMDWPLNHNTYYHWSFSINGYGAQVINLVGSYLISAPFGTTMQVLPTATPTPTVEPTATEYPASSCDVVIPDGDPIGEILPDPGLGGRTCLDFWPIHLDLSLLSFLGISMPPIDTPEFHLCVRAITFGNLKILGLVFNLDDWSLVFSMIGLIALMRGK